MGIASKFLIKSLLQIHQSLGHERISVCIETGTYRGDSTQILSNLFGKVHTIELSETWYQKTKARLSDHTNIEFHFGDSSDTLPKLLMNNPDPTLFFLDAHFAGGSTAMGPKEVPLLEELGAIRLRAQKDIIVIDDVRLFGSTGVSGRKDSEVYPLMTFDWRDITQQKVMETVGTANSKSTWIFRDQCIVFTNLTSSETEKISGEMEILTKPKKNLPKPEKQRSLAAKLRKWLLNS